MEKTKKILSLTLILTFLVGSLPLPIFAEDNVEEVLTAPEEACKTLKPGDYTDKNMPKPGYKNDKEIIAILGKKNLTNRQVYDAIFERAQTSYHSYVGCMFEFAENSVYKTEAAESAGGVQANTPNTKLIDWMAPKQACLPPAELSKIVEETTPTQVLGPVLQAHADYKQFLNERGALYTQGGGEGASDGTEEDPIGLDSLANALTEVERERQVEIDTAMVALDLMLHSLKELRLAFVMHVNFQCTLKFLDKYRAKLGELRKLIQPLPAQLRDASVTK